MTLLAQIIYQSYLNSQSKLLAYLLLKARNLLLKVCNPTIKCHFRGFTFYMPLSHTIFIVQKRYPSYDMQLRNIAQYIYNKKSAFSMVDVGSNIGDTCCFVGLNDASYLLCEGEKSYANLIAKNIELNFGKKVMGGGHNENNEYTLIDFGGGTGLLVRLLRDVGIESLWSDEYCENLFARGFEYNERKKYNLALGTSFEVFEHLPNPKESIDAMLRICPNLLFSTELLPLDIPIFSGKNKWWYYGFEHGQHISFYTQKSLEIIAKSHNLYFVSYGNIHCMSEQKINPFLFAWIIRLSHKGLFSLAKRKLKSKTINDSQILSGERL